MRRHSVLAFLFPLFCLGCSYTRHAVPMNLVNDAQIVGMENVRVFCGMPNDAILHDLIQSLEQESKKDFPEGPDGITVYPVLAISGGAANGAYGAGLLKGWSDDRSRPVFKIVTGISTGAIIAPLAFLGEDYDALLETFFTQHGTKDIVKRKNLLRAIFSNSALSNEPLIHLIKENFNDGILRAIAREHARGRRLYVGTTHLDAQRLVLWDMGKIASIGGEEALALFQKVIIASTAIPAVFPPEYFDVEADGKRFDEMHVDGGVVRQVFFIYEVMKTFDRVARSAEIDFSKKKPVLYIIRNGYADPVWKEVDDKIGSIAERAVDTMANAQSLGDLYRMYTFSKMREDDFNLAYIPSEHIPNAREFFDPNEMRRLFDLGYHQALRGYPWKKAPPGIR